VVFDTHDDLLFLNYIRLTVRELKAIIDEVYEVFGRTEFKETTDMVSLLEPIYRTSVQHADFHIPR